MTSLFVTHDQEEAFEVADKVVVMNEGRIEQTGTPAEVFEHPANAFVMDFLGNVNVFPVQLLNGRAMLGPGRDAPAAHPDRPGTRAGCSSARTSWRSRGTREGSAALEAKVTHINPAGSVVKVRLVAEQFGLAHQRGRAPGPVRGAAAEAGRGGVHRPEAGPDVRRDYVI